MVRNRKERSFRASALVDSPMDQVWQCLLDPQAMRWMISHCVFVAPEPNGKRGLGAVYCGWQRHPEGDLRQLINEVSEVDEALHRVTFSSRHQLRFSERLTFELSQQPNGTKGDVTDTQSRYRFEGSGRDVGLQAYVERLANAIQGEVNRTDAFVSDPSSIAVPLAF